MNPLFSIIVPVHNREASIERALDSIAAQTYRPVQLLLVDNASSDSSVKVMAAWGARNAADDLEVWLIHEPQRGPAAARQAGLDMAKGEYVAFLDSDDSFRSDALEKYADVFARTGADLVTTETQLHSLAGPTKRLLPRKGNMLINHLHHSTLFTMGYAARKRLFDSVGGWNRQLRIWEDWELGLRLLLADPVCSHTGTVTADKYESGVSVTGSSYSEKHRHYEDTLKAVEQTAMTMPQPTKESLLFYMQYRRIMLAARFAREGHPELALPLKKRVMSQVKGRRDRLLLRLAYSYIKRGGRGYDRLLSRLSNHRLRSTPPA